MAETTVVGLRLEDLWQIYEAENPLAETLRRIVAIESDDLKRDLSLFHKTWTPFER